MRRCIDPPQKKVWKEIVVLELSYPALACADIVHVALVRMLVDTHRFSTALKVLQRMTVGWQSYAFNNKDKIGRHSNTVSVILFKILVWIPLDPPQLSTTKSQRQGHSQCGSSFMCNLLHFSFWMLNTLYNIECQEGIPQTFFNVDNSISTKLTCIPVLTGDYGLDA